MTLEQIKQEMLREFTLVFSLSNTKQDSKKRFVQRYEARKARLIARWDKILQEELRA